MRCQFCLKFELDEYNRTTCMQNKMLINLKKIYFKCEEYEQYIYL